jgi:hypothetical protein
MAAGNRWSDKEWRSALRTALLEKHPKHGTNLRAVADMVVQSAIAGDMEAAKEIGNRLDGRPSQEVAIQQTVTHDLTKFTDAQLAALIARGIEGDSGGSDRGPAPEADTGKLH